MARPGRQCAPQRELTQWAWNPGELLAQTPTDHYFWCWYKCFKRIIMKINKKCIYISNLPVSRAASAKVQVNGIIFNDKVWIKGRVLLNSELGAGKGDSFLPIIAKLLLAITSVGKCNGLWVRQIKKTANSVTTLVSRAKLDEILNISFLSRALTLPISLSYNRI